MSDKVKSSKYSDPEFQKFLAQIKVIGETESGGNYSAANPTPGQTATGKYQYNKSHLAEIKKYSRELGMPVNTLEEFKNNPGLQEAYFQHDQYKAYEWAKKKMVNENPFNYNLAELAGLRHFQGESGANTILKTGKHKKSDSIGNPSTNEYIENRFRPALKAAGLYELSGVEKNRIKANDKSISLEQRQKIQKQYFQDQKKIKDQKLDPVIENQMLTDLNQKYFNEGNLELINRKIDYKNNKNTAPNIENEYKTKKALADKFTGKVNQEGKTITNMKYTGGMDSDKDLADLAKQFGENPKAVLRLDNRVAPWYDARDHYVIDPTSKTGQFLLNPTPETLLKQLPKTEKLENIDITQYEQPVVETINIDGETTETTTTTSPAQTSVPSSKPNTPAGVTTAPQDKSFSDNEVNAMFDGGMFQDETFTYKPGLPNIPFESVGYLLAGLEGVKAGNVEMPERDEQVGPALRNYGAELAKISKMGLAPEMEADLKNKLSQAYQTGLQNIVRASGGNRNLVLGNQGQLDMARMSGLTDIALMDLDRRDKAMAGYGEVAKYISDFDANRDIANNERQYREAEKTQIAGAQLAQQGFTSLIDSLRFAKENAPGSANDMLKQYMMYSITGVNPGIEDDGSGTVKGTPSYAKVQSENLRAQQGEREKMKSFYGSQTKEDKQKFNEFLKENEQLRPHVNKDVTFDQLKEGFDAYNGVPVAKEEMANAQGTVSEEGISISENNLNSPENTSLEPFAQLSALSANKSAATNNNNNNNSSSNFVFGNEIGGITTAKSPKALTEEEKAMERFRTANDALHKYLQETDTVTESLDNLITKTEEDTNKLKLQIPQY